MEDVALELKFDGHKVIQNQETGPRHPWPVEEHV